MFGVSSAEKALPRGPCSFSDLPVELLHPIFEHLDTTSLLASLSTCRRWSDVVLPILYRDVQVDARQGAFLIRTIAAVPEHGSYIKRLSFKYEHKCVDAHAADVLIAARNIEDLRIIGPTADDRDEPLCYSDPEEDFIVEYPRWSAEADRLICLLGDSKESRNHLPCLRSCDFSYKDFSDHNELSWNLESHDSLFFHRQLESLTIRDGYHNTCHNPMIWKQAKHHRGTTALRSLNFHRCLIDVDILQKILSLPRSLKHFTFTYARCREDGSQISTNTVRFVEKLLQQSESLETIHLQSLYHGSLGASFSTFKKLRELDIELGVLFYGGAGETNRGYALNSIAIKDLLPPSLELLVLRYSAEQYRDEDRFRIAPIQTMLARKRKDLPCLRELTLLRETAGRSLDECDLDLVAPKIQVVCRDVGVKLITGGHYQEYTNGYFRHWEPTPVP